MKLLIRCVGGGLVGAVLPAFGSVGFWIGIAGIAVICVADFFD